MRFFIRYFYLTYLRNSTISAQVLWNKKIMAIYDNLPVYKTTYDLLLNLFKVCQNMERDYKFTIGEKLKNEIVELIINVYRANSRVEKADCIQKARENTEVVRLLLRLLNDLKQMNLTNFVELSEKLESISKQLAAWFNSCKKVS